MSDTLGRLTTLQMMVLCSAFAMPAASSGAQQPSAFLCPRRAVYWCYGTQLSVFASTTADFYGTRTSG